MSVLRRPGGSRVLSLGVAVGISSMVGYALLAIIGRVLTPSDFGLFVSFWGVMFGLASSLSTVEQEAARQSAQRATSGEAPIRRVALAAGLIATSAAVLTLLPPVAARLYGDPHSKLGLFVVLATVGFSFQFVVRGVLIGAGQVGGYTGLLIVEAGSRLILLLLVWVTLGITLGTAAAAVTIGAFAWIRWGPQTLALTRRDPQSVDAAPPGWRAPFGRATYLMVAAALTASMITGYPAMVTVFAGGDLGDAGGIVFAALTVSRVPLLFVAPLQALAVPTVVRWRQNGSASTNPHRLILKAMITTLAIACVGAVAAWFIGPWGVQLAYGSNYIVAPAAVAALVFSACLLGFLQLLSAALVAFGSYRSMIALWASAVVGTVAWLSVSPFDIVTSTAVGAVIGPLVGSVIGVWTLWKIVNVPLAPSGDPLTVNDFS